MTTTTRRQITQPADWWAAFQKQADAEGLTVSQWLGECGLANLTAAERKQLSKRPAVGAPTKGKRCAEQS